MSFLSSGNHHLRQVVKMAINYQGKRDVTLRQEIFDLVRPLAPALARESGGVWYYVSTKDYGLSRIVFATGSYEQDIMDHTIALAETHVGRSPLLDGRIFLDIGANIGTSTIPALKTFGAAEAVSIEPDNENYKFLRCNLIANEVDDRVQTLQVALSEREGTGTLEVAEESWGDHRVRMKSGLPDGVYRESTRRVTPVRLMSFDDMAREISLDLSRVGIVWMDVQGHEGHVLAGAKSLLASETPLAIEYWPYGLRRADGLDMLHRLIADNYRTVVDVRASMEGSDTAELHATEVSTLAGRYGGETYTDLLILK
jgi:FkbM family methyltransferase